MKWRVVSKSDEPDNELLNDADAEDFVRRFVEFETNLRNFTERDFMDLSEFLDVVVKWVTYCSNVSLIKYVTNLRDFKPSILAIYDY